MRYLITIFFLLFLFCPEIKAQSTIKEDGSLWVVMSDTEKHFYVQGYNQGVSYGQLFCFGMMTLGGNFDTASSNQAVKNEIQWKYNNLAKALEHNFSSDDIVKQINALYKTSENKKIRMATMVNLAIDKLKGKNITESVLRWRKHFEKDN